jgi:hypothetical protein
LHLVEVDKVVITLSTIYNVHPSHIAPSFKNKASTDASFKL